MPHEEDDVEVTGGGYGRPWGLYAVVALLVVALAAGGVASWMGHGGGGSVATATHPTSATPTAPSRTPQRGSTPSPAPSGASRSPGQRQGPGRPTCDVSLPAVAFRGVDRRAGSGLNRWDCNAVPDGPWAWVLRDASGGTLGHDGAVVTFPVDPSGTDLADPGDRHRLAWTSPREVLVRVGDQYARVCGDLGRARLAALAARLRLGEDDYLHLSAPPGMTIVGGGIDWYRPPLTREIRYAAEQVGEEETFGGGLVYAAVQDGAQFEDELYAATDDHPAGRVHGHPAVFSQVGGGSLTLAWQPRPGIVALVGYSGGLPDRAVRQALHRLADRLQLLPASAWPTRVASVYDTWSDG